MATWLTHLRVAEKLLETLGNIEKTAFYVGAIAPDSGRMVGDFTYLPTKDVTHWKREGVSYAQRFEDNAEFFKKYAEGEQDNAKFSFYLGYYVHILTDTIYVRDVIHPFINKNGRPCWRENITGIRKGWYEIDFRYLVKNNGYLPLGLLSGIEDFRVTSIKYFAPNDICERIRYAVELYASPKVDPECVFFTHNEADCENFVVYASAEIRKILNEKHNI
jgi:hypothetical protein